MVGASGEQLGSSLRSRGARRGLFLGACPAQPRKVRGENREGAFGLPFPARPRVIPEAYAPCC